MAPSVRFVPRSLTTPGGAIFLDPAHRVSGEELNRRDARWRALRERAYARAWSDDATLVGSVHLYAATALRDIEERTLGRSSGSRRVPHSDESSSLHRPRSFRDGASVRRISTMESNHDGRLLRLLRGTKRGRRFRLTLTRLVGGRV